MSQRPRRKWQMGLIAWFMMMLAVIAAFFNIVNPAADPIWQVYAFGLVFGLAGMGALGVEPSFRSDARQLEVVYKGIMFGAILVSMQLAVSMSAPLVDFGVAQELAVLAAISEELIFRLLIYGSLRAAMPRWPWYVAGASSAGVFTLFHFFVFGVELLAMVVLFLGGLILAYCFESVKDIGAPMIAHLLNNSMAYINVVVQGVFDMWWIGVVVIGAYVVWMFMGARRR